MTSATDYRRDQQTTWTHLRTGTQSSKGVATSVCTPNSKASAAYRAHTSGPLKGRAMGMGWVVATIGVAIGMGWVVATIGVTVGTADPASGTPTATAPWGCGLGGRPLARRNSSWRPGTPGSLVGGGGQLKAYRGKGLRLGLDLGCWGPRSGVRIRASARHPCAARDDSAYSPFGFCASIEGCTWVAHGYNRRVKR